MIQSQNRHIAIGKIKDIASRVNFRDNPFLYYLPMLLETNEFRSENPDKILEFALLTQKPMTPPIVKDALNILNQLVDPENGALIERGRDIFYQNRSFVWNELGGHTKPIDIISHILNRTLFYLSMGK